MVHEDVCMFSQDTCVCVTVQLTVGFIIEGERAKCGSSNCTGVSGWVLIEKVTLPPLPPLPPDGP